MSDPTKNIFPDVRPPVPPDREDDSHQHPIPGTSWKRHTPPPALRVKAEFDNDVEAAKGVALAGKTLAASRTGDGKSYVDLFDLKTKINAGRLELSLTPKSGHEITEVAYDAARRIEQAWREALDKGVLGMKPERTQVWQDTPSLQAEPALQQVFDTRRISDSAWEQVTYYHTVVGEYHYASNADATAACETVLKAVDGTAAVPTVTVSGRTLRVELRSSQGYLLTEVEFGFVREIEAALSERPEPLNE